MRDATVEKGIKWEDYLRQMAGDFVALKIQSNDEAALLWLLQRTIVGLLLIGVEPALIRQRVDAALPPKREGA